MQFSVLALSAIVALVVAGPAARDHSEFIRKRQNAITGGIPVNQPAMTDANGNVIAFDPNNVYLDSVAKGL